MKDQNDMRFLGWIAAAAMGWGLLAQIGWAEQTKAEQANPYDLQPRRQIDQTDRVTVQLEVEGILVISDDPKHARPKMKVSAQTVYDERLLELDPKTHCPARSVRYYHTAEAAIQIEQETIRPQLRPEHRWIVAQAAPGQVHLFSAKGALTREELDLIDLLGNTLVLDRLLPTQPVDQKASWRPTEQTLAILLGLDKVSQADVHCKPSSLSERSILVEISGTVQGVSGGGQSAMVLKGKYRVDRATGRINWFGLAVAERRSPGPVLRGVDIVAKLSVQITPASEAPQLSEQLLRDLPLQADEQRLLLAYQPPGKGWQILHPRSWHVNREEGQTAVLGLFEEDQWVAQGTFTLLAPLPQGQDVSLEQFQQEIQQALGKNFGQFMQAGQYPAPENQRMYRVVVQGKVLGQVQNKPVEVPMCWHYYRLADAKGRQAVCAFSMEADQEERLGQADKALVESFRFLDQPTPPEHPTPAGAKDQPNPPQPEQPKKADAHPSS